MILSKEEKKLLLELICDEQIHIIVKDNSKYDSDKYKRLEELKIKIKDIDKNINIDIGKSPGCYGEYDNESKICKQCIYCEVCK